MNPILFAIPVFMATIVFEAWLAWRRGRAVYDVADAITSLHFGVLSQVSAAFTRLFSFGVYAWLYQFWHWLSLPTDSVWVWLVALLLYDFLYYWVHRFGHEVNVMWAAHQVHHSSEYFNLSTALRQSATTVLWSWPFYLPMALLGVPPEVFVGVALIDLLYQYWVHTELVGKLGWFDRVFVSPSNHRVHHGQNDYCIDKNYGGILIVWDRLFGSFVEERDREPVIYGIRKPLASFNPVWGNCNVYAELLRNWRRATTWRERLAALFGPPGGGAALTPLDPGQCRRFDPQPSVAVRVYALFNYALLVLYVSHFLLVVAQLSWPEQPLYGAFIVLATLTQGWLLERHRWAVRAEQLRWSVTLLLLWWQPAWFGTVLPLGVKLVLSIVALAAMAMLVTPIGLMRPQQPRQLPAKPQTDATANPANFESELREPEQREAKQREAKPRA